MASAPILGIDFGTSNSAAALMHPAGHIEVMALDGNRNEMPTAVFFPLEHQPVLYGSEAMRAYLCGTEGRLLRSLKSLLGSALMEEYTAVGDQSVRFFDIVVLFLKELKRRCEMLWGQPLDRAVLGRPVHFVDDNPERDALAEFTLGQAAKQAGFTRHSFQLEPIAAALDFEQRVDRETLALVVDIGGGTSDFTVIRLHPSRSAFRDRASDILSTTGVHIGGTDFDRLLDLRTVMPFLGYQHQNARGRPVPNSIFFDLSTWHLIQQTHTRKALHFAKELWTDYQDLALHRRLMEVVEGQFGHRILNSVEAAKISCSVTGQPADLVLDFLREPIVAWIDAEGMESALQKAVEQVVNCASACVAQAGLEAVDVVYLTGGSSALKPLVSALQARMPTTTLVEGNRFGGVACGLAVTGAALLKEQI